MARRVLRLSLILVFCEVLAYPVNAADQATGTDKRHIAVFYRDNKLTMFCRDAPLSEVLQAISERVGLKVKTRNALQKRVSGSYILMPPAELLHNLLRDYSFVMTFRDSPISATEIYPLKALIILRSRRVLEGPDETSVQQEQIAETSREDPDTEYLKAQYGKISEFVARDDLAGLAEVLLRHEGSRFRAFAASMLSSFQGDDAAAILSLALDDPEPMVRMRVIYALGKVGGPEAETTLAEILRSGEDVHERISAGIRLSRFKGQAAREALVWALGDENTTVQEVANRALADLD